MRVSLVKSSSLALMLLSVLATRHGSTLFAFAEIAPCRSCAEGVSKSLNGEKEAAIVFCNQTTEPRRIFWLDYEGKRVLYMTLGPGESYLQLTYLTHPWLIADSSGTGLAIYLPMPGRNRVTLHPTPVRR